MGCTQRKEGREFQPRVTEGRVKNYIFTLDATPREYVAQLEDGVASVLANLRARCFPWLFELPEQRFPAFGTKSLPTRHSRRPEYPGILWRARSRWGEMRARRSVSLIPNRARLAALNAPRQVGNRRRRRWKRLLVHAREIKKIRTLRWKLAP